MVRNPLVTFLLVLFAVAAVTNPVWLFPAEGDSRYVYERAPVDVEDGSLTHAFEDTDRVNDLEGIACDFSDHSTLPRACAFDEYLRQNGPVTIAADEGTDRDPRVVALNGSYYERLERSVSDGYRYDVERRSAAEVRRLLADDAPKGPLEHAPLAERVAVRGGTVYAETPPRDDSLGQIYRVDGDYYTVGVLREAPLDRQPLVSPLTRVLLALVGLGSLGLAGARIRHSRRAGS